MLYFREIDRIASEYLNKIIVLRRRGRTGLKAGALNSAMKYVETLGVKYVLILDADFEPPPNLLKRMVCLAETYNADVVQGHQAHRKGVRDAFGLLYNSSMGGAMVFMAGRRELGMFPIFTGSVALIKLDRLIEIPFKEGSLSEDLRWAIDYALEYGLDSYVADPWSEAIGSVPKSLKAFYRQQLRWSSGTLIETLTTLKDVLLSNRLEISHKLGYLLQGFFYTQGLFIYASTIIPLIELLIGIKPPIWPLGLYIWLIGIATIILAGGLLEKRKTGDLLKIILILIPYIYFTSFIHSVGTLKVLIKGRGEWIVTSKRGVYEDRYT